MQQKWNYLVIAAGWTLSMIYEYIYRPQLLSMWLLATVVVDLILVVMWFWQRRKERRGEGRDPFTASVYGAVVVMLIVLLVCAIVGSSRQDPPHVLLLPLYIVLIADYTYLAVVTYRSGKK